VRQALKGLLLELPCDTAEGKISESSQRDERAKNEEKKHAAGNDASKSPVLYPEFLPFHGIQLGTSTG
jgi:hypothetical protein